MTTCANSPRFIRLSRKTHALLVQNIVLALGIKAVFLILTLTGMGTMWMAVFADVGASLLVVANGLRLLRFRGRRQLLERMRAHLVKMTVPADSIVKTFNVIKHI